ncbi:cilia- and flagella-associated protein 161 [Lutzomyia longipalpis]|uniref:cilia- and flagella-associated protein 161 n=1 Tax=Lutzomyia longipalpis TaxID=7200 RepID=UPI0024847071|nr:cilia- and flagella-associated protein 161 [Lutzomyia longipalpis]
MFSESTWTNKLLDKKNNGDLCVQKENNFRQILMKKIIIDSSESFIKFGSLVQLARQPSAVKELRYLSLSADYVSISMYTHSIDECSILTLSSSNYPCIRNTFEIFPLEDDLVNSPLKYNQDFLLRCIYWEDNKPMGLMASPNTWANGERNHDIKLKRIVGNSLSHYRWKFIHPDCEVRLEMEGEYIPFNKKVILVHSLTNRILTNEGTSVRTIFDATMLHSEEL